MSASAGVGTTRIEAVGELDIASAPVLRAVLQAAQASARLVLLDLHGITFMDTAGLHVLEDASIEALCADKRLVLVRVPRQAMRAVELCGLTAVLEVLEGEPVEART